MTSFNYFTNIESCLILYINLENDNWGEEMLTREIERLRGMLNEMILNKADNKLIYDLSIELDQLIVNYYREADKKMIQAM